MKLKTAQPSQILVRKFDANDLWVLIWNENSFTIFFLSLIYGWIRLCTCMRTNHNRINLSELGARRFRWRRGCSFWVSLSLRYISGADNMLSISSPLRRGNNNSTTIYLRHSYVWKIIQANPNTTYHTYGFMMTAIHIRTAAKMRKKKWGKKSKRNIINVTAAIN